MDFKICHIGCGAISKVGHGPALSKYAAEKQNTILAGCCDNDATGAEGFASDFGFLKSYTDVRRMLQIEMPDAVSLAVPVDKTACLAIQIAEMGFDLILEKPPGMDTGECERIIKAVRENGTAAMTAFNRRHMPVMMKLASLLDEAGRDSITDIRYDFIRTGRKDIDFSTTAIHAVDAVQFIAGCGFFEYGITVDKGSGGVGNIYIAGGMESGARVCVNLIPDGGLNIERARVTLPGETWFVKIPVWGNVDYPGGIIRYANGAEKDGYIPADAEQFVNSGFYFEHSNFYDALRKGEKPPFSVENDLGVVKIMEEIRHELKNIGKDNRAKVFE